MKNEKKLRGFSFSINMANFEAFCWTKKLISNLFFLKSVHGKTYRKQVPEIPDAGSISACPCSVHSYFLFWPSPVGNLMSKDVQPKVFAHCSPHSIKDFLPLTFGHADLAFHPGPRQTPSPT